MIAITGSENGFLSSYLFKRLQPAEFISRDTRRNQSWLNEWLDRYNPDCVVHCAGLANVRLCIEDPTMAYQANTIDTITLLNALEGRNIKLIYVATDKVFGDQEHCTLNTGYKPLNSYDASKVGAEIILADWSQRNTCLLARFPNFYGAGDPHIERLVPSVLKAIIEKQRTFSVRTNAEFSRQYIFIEDAVKAIAQLIVADWPSTRHHFGTNIVKTVREVVMDLCELFNHKMDLVEQNLPGEASRLSLAYDTQMMVQFTSWQESLKAFQLTASG